ncbi:MAG: DUF3857 domain-containing protein [Ignavibacteriales bacterium]|nr:MAG: DUF3857 domain-containing protein [Ignavibacteriales bacterium]
MKKCYLLIPIFIIIIFSKSYTQDFGEIPEELLKMTSLAEDPEEDAAIIFDKAKLKITKDFLLETKRHVRIKVFTEEGKKQANIEIVLWHEDEIDDIEAISISPDGKEYELDSDNIYTEEGERTNKISFPIPGVEVGSVFEYSYSVRSEYISNLEPWSFQTNIYTKYSEVQVYLPSGFAYQRMNTNLLLYDFEESVEEALDPDNRQKRISVFKWSCRNLPGIKDEPYTDHISDNFAKMRFVLISFQNEYVSLKFAKTWDDVATRIYKIYNDLMDDDAAESKVKELINTETVDLKKANVLYKYVTNNIKTTAHKSLIGDLFKEPEDVLKDKSGSSSEKSMLLINMLKIAGLDAKPVWISTRNNGVISPEFCDGSQFNRLICVVKINSKNYFLYPVSARSPFGCLTPSTEVANGFLIEEGKGSIISITPEPVISSININTMASISTEKELIANTVIEYLGYAALDEYDAITEKDINIYVKDYLKEYFSEAKLDTFYYENVDSVNKPLTLKLKFRIENYLEETDDLGYFPLPFFTALKENPFVRPKRINPIEYEYPFSKTENIKVELPESFLVSQIPTKRKNLITDLGFNQVYATGKNYVECVRAIGIKNRRLPAKNYGAIKSFYDDVVGASQDQIVISKSATGN